MIWDIIYFVSTSSADAVGAGAADLGVRRGLGHAQLLRRGAPNLPQLLGEGNQYGKPQEKVPPLVSDH